MKKNDQSAAVTAELIAELGADAVFLAELADATGLSEVSSEVLDGLRDARMRSIVSASSADVLTLAVVCALLETRAADAGPD